MENVLIVESASKYDKMLKQVDEQTNTLLQVSIDHERTKSKCHTLSRHLKNFLDSFEGRFDSDEGAYSPEHMLEYIDAAKYMELNFGRVNNRIKDVTEKLNALPFGS
jgi:hypothetical protein